MGGGHAGPGLRGTRGPVSAWTDGTVGFLKNRIAMARADLRTEREKDVPDFVAVAEARSRLGAAQLDLYWYQTFLDI